MVKSKRKGKQPVNVATTDKLAVRAVAGLGRGVFTLVPFKEGDTVEVAPILFIDADEKKVADETVLSQYMYGWPTYGESVKGNSWSGGAICLGFGSLYNHSDTPNMTRFHWIEPQMADNVIKFVALCDIAEGEQLTIDYGFVTPDYTFPACE